MAGAFVAWHARGRSEMAVQGAAKAIKIIERGADYTEPVEPPPNGDLTLAEAKKLAAGRITLGGNIEARLLQYGRHAVTNG